VRIRLDAGAEAKGDAPMGAASPRWSSRRCPQAYPRRMRAVDRGR